jgi:hypothetical protein
MPHRLVDAFGRPWRTSATPTWSHTWWTPDGGDVAADQGCEPGAPETRHRVEVDDQFVSTVHDDRLKQHQKDFDDCGATQVTGKIDAKGRLIAAVWHA